MAGYSKMKVTITDISDWIERPLNTEGTRNKSVLISPYQGGEYYFKTSMMKGKKNYPFEFWSEVVASKVGKALGFNVADYNVGILREDDGTLTVGALVASVHDDSENLVSGYNLVVQYYPQFHQPEIYKNKHSLELIRKTLSYHGLDSSFNGMLECMVFDAIIGNTDRHSENWAFIRTKEYGAAYDKTFLQLIRDKNMWYARIVTAIINTIIYPRFRMTLRDIRQQANREFMRLSILYDNGSSLGREMSQERIEQILKKPDELEKYIIKGKPDIKVREGKTTFLETMECLCYDYPKEMRAIIKKLKSCYEKEKIVQLISLFDQVPEISQIPQELHLSKERKEFITSIITERIERIINIGNRICVKS